MAAFQDYKIIPGFDNSGTLVSIETVLPVYRGGVVGILQSRGSFTPGLIRPRADRLRTTSGYSFVEWLFPYLSIAQWDFIQTTYTVGGNSYSGKVTIRTLSEANAFTNLNAYLYLPQQADFEIIQDALLDVIIPFSIDGAAS